MPPDKPAPPANPAPAPSSGGIEDRVSGLEAEQRRQGGVLDQILARLPGGKAPAAAGPADPAPAAGGKSVAEQVREGIEALERERAAEAEGKANRDARTSHEERLRALEERSPAETAATPVGAFKAAAQRVMFGITTPGK